MEVTSEQKKDLKKVLKALQSEEEKSKDYNDLVVEKLDGIGRAITELLKKPQDTGLLNVLDSLQKTLEGSKLNVPRLTDKVVSSFGEVSEKLVSKLEEVNTSFKSKKSTDYAPTLQNVIRGLSGMDSTIKEGMKSGWGMKFPQYLYSGSRDTQFSPVDPAIDPFSRGMFDDVKATYDGSGNLSTVSYYKNKALKAVLTLSYDGSGNLLEVKRTT